MQMYFFHRSLRAFTPQLDYCTMHVVNLNDRFSPMHMCCILSEVQLYIYYIEM